MTTSGSWSTRPSTAPADDGQDPLHTPKVLDLLDDAGARATFFVVGERAARASDLLREIVARGHEVENYTWSHANLWLCAPRRTDREIVRAHEAIADLTGRPPQFFRPPWGMVNLAVFPTLRRLGTPCVLWSLQPEGLRPVAPEEMARRVVQRVGRGRSCISTTPRGRRGGTG